VLGNFTGSLRSDIGVITRENGKRSIKIISNPDGTTTTYEIKNPAKYLVTGCDFDGDKKTDLAGINTVGGVWWINQSSTGQVVKIKLAGLKALEADAVSCADLNRDGVAELLVLKTAHNTDPNAAYRRIQTVKAYNTKRDVVFLRKIKNGRELGVVGFSADPAKPLNVVTYRSGRIRMYELGSSADPVKITLPAFSSLSRGIFQAADGRRYAGMLIKTQTAITVVDPANVTSPGLQPRPPVGKGKLVSCEQGLDFGAAPTPAGSLNTR
jgi:hypothetical protein